MKFFVCANLVIGPGSSIYSRWKLRLRDTGEKVKQNGARNNANFSKCLQFLCNNNDRTKFYNALITFVKSLRRCWKPPASSVFNIFLGTWRMLMHEKPCLIPIFNVISFIQHRINRYNVINAMCPPRTNEWSDGQMTHKLYAPPTSSKLGSNKSET